jgi:hypothetical protein
MLFQPVVRWCAFRIPEEHLLEGQMLLVITAVLPGKSWNTSLNRPLLFSTTSFPIYYWLIILPFDAMHYGILMSSDKQKNIFAKLQQCKPVKKCNIDISTTLINHVLCIRAFSPLYCLVCAC